jgi:hypothetical protein
VRSSSQCGITIRQTNKVMNSESLNSKAEPVITSQAENTDLSPLLAPHPYQEPRSVILIENQEKGRYQNNQTMQPRKAAKVASRLGAHARSIPEAGSSLSQRSLRSVFSRKDRDELESQI